MQPLISGRRGLVVTVSDSHAKLAILKGLRVKETDTCSTDMNYPHSFSMVCTKLCFSAKQSLLYTTWISTQSIFTWPHRFPKQSHWPFAHCPTQNLNFISFPHSKHHLRAISQHSNLHVLSLQDPYDLSGLPVLLYGFYETAMKMM